MSHIQLNKAFKVIWSIFTGLLKIFSFGAKNSPLQKEAITQKLFFLSMFEKKVNLEENLDWWKQIFLVRPVEVTIIKKLVFLFQMSHIHLNKAF